MIEKKKIAQFNAEMGTHANGAAQFLDAFFGGKYISNEKAREMLDYILAEAKKNIECCPFATQEEKDAEIQRREYLMNMLKSQMGI